MKNDITKSTRKDIFDWLSIENVRWFGRLDDVQFLSRIFDLDELPSTDHRFSRARADIAQHRIHNEDWEDDWIYSDSRFNLMACDDETFLLFLAEMLHPFVRKGSAEAEQLATMLNDLIRGDGFELVVKTRIGGLPVWAARRLSLRGSAALPAMRQAKRKFNADYMLQQITRMEAAVDSDPALAIGTAKELLETTCKAILEARGVAVSGNEDMPKLIRLVSTELDLLADRAGQSRDPQSTRRILGSLGTIASGIAELRNAYGTGHGRSPGAQGLKARHARLAVGSATTLAVFLYETHEERTGGRTP